MAADWLQTRIVERIDWDEGLFSIRLDTPLPPFRPGQFAQLALLEGEKRVHRAYSLASAPHELPEFFIVEVEDGRLTPRFARMGPGEVVYMAPKAKGFFTLNEVPAAREMWFLSTGTGLAPYLSMLRTDEPWERFEHIVLVHGVRTRGNLAYAQELIAHAERHPGRFTYVPMVTREDPPPGGLAGRIPPALADGSLEAVTGLQLDPARSHVMLCGNPAMIQDAISLLGDRGLKKHRRREPGHVTTERYW